MQGRLENEIKTARAIDKILEPLPKYITEWYIDLKKNNVTLESCRDYIRKARQFLSYIDENYKVEPEDITIEVCESYMIAYQTRKDYQGMIVYTSLNYRRTVVFALNSLLNFMANKGYIKQNYLNDIDKHLDINIKNKSKQNNKPKKILTTQEFNKIIKFIRYNNIESNNILHNRNKLILMIFMTTGIQNHTMTEINISDIDRQNNILTVFDKDNNKTEYMLSDSIINILDLWLIDRENLVNHSLNDALFVNKYGERITNLGISKAIKNISQQAIGRTISPQQLRAGFCSVLYNKTKDLHLVSKAVGHSNVSVTEKYIKTNGKEREKAARIMNEILK